MIREHGGEAVVYVDDITISVTGEPNRNTGKLGIILNECVTWARQHHTEIDLGEKLGFIHFLADVRSSQRCFNRSGFPIMKYGNLKQT